ncbi:MAG: alpha/beta hydrolase [Anaerolineales bacterium]|nr:alpha/beta hydrolase [Anaerolineales bacterium]MCB9145229.1 alpha/beta hydrolase [Anaerolineales bacterium]
MKKIRVNGIELAFERYGSGMPLVLLHGFPLDHSIWMDVVPLLQNDFDLILPDLRGFGESTAVDTQYSMNDFAADLFGLLNLLGLEKAAFAGHSMGGYVALAFAKLYPARISGLALVSSQAAADTPERKEGRYKTAEDVKVKGVGTVADAMTNKLSTDPHVREFIRPLILRQSASAVTGALRAMAEREDMMLSASTFSVPLFLLHGIADELIPIERAREIKALKNDAKLVELAGVGHMPMMESAAQVADALKMLR